MRVKRADKITIGTFHSICYSILGDVSLAERALQLKLARETIAEFGMKCTPRRFLSDVSAYKNGNGEKSESIVAYCRRLRQAGVADFDDLLSIALERGNKTFGWLQVDEFQDVIPMQYSLVH